MATQPIADRFIAEAEYLSRCYEPDCEYDDGLLMERNGSEFDHSYLQGILTAIFLNNEENWGVYGLPEQRVRIAQRRYRIPDVSVLSLDAPTERILTQPPLIAIEILSREDTFSRVARKCHEYAEFGIEHVWVVDPRERQVYRGSARGLERVADGILTVPGTPIRVDANQLFAKLDRMRQRGRKL